MARGYRWTDAGRPRLLKSFESLSDDPSRVVPSRGAMRGPLESGGLNQPEPAEQCPCPQQPEQVNPAAPDDQGGGRREQPDRPVFHRTAVGSSQNPGRRKQQRHHDGCHALLERAHRPQILVSMAPAGCGVAQQGARDQMPSMAMNTPSRPLSMPPAFRPTFQPSRATNSTLGPGAACAMAIEALNCASVNQCC